jgi:ParB-like chromosome segregation protein Spo0J
MMEIHPVAEAFPAMSAEEFAALTDDIRKHGLLEPIWTYQGRIIDGRHRYWACEELEIEPRYQEWAGEGGSVLAFIVAKNLHRRHLTAAQRAAIAAEMKPKIKAEIKEKLKEKAKESGARGGRGHRKGPDKSDKTLSGPGRNARAEVAEMFGVAPAYVSQAERIKEASPETFREMKAGKMSVTQAAKKAGVSANKKKDAATDAGENQPPPGPRARGTNPVDDVARRAIRKLEDTLPDGNSLWGDLDFLKEHRHEISRDVAEQLRGSIGSLEGELGVKFHMIFVSTTDSPMSPELTAPVEENTCTVNGVGELPSASDPDTRFSFGARSRDGHVLIDLAGTGDSPAEITIDLDLRDDRGRAGRFLRVIRDAMDCTLKPGRAPRNDGRGAEDASGPPR